MGEENIERLKAKRRGHRVVTTKLIREANAIFENPDVSTLNHSRLKVINNLLAEKEKLLQEMDDQVLSVCKVEEIEKEIEDSDVIRSRILEVKGRIECLDISKLSASVNTSPTTIDDLPHQQEVIAEQDMLSQDEEQQGQTEGLQTSVPSGGGVLQWDGLPLASATITPKLPKLVLQKFNGDITKFIDVDLEHFGLIR